ncbi:Galactose oxidase/kelch repeat superfamily protein [Balamuthia mandrillaris]
MGKRNKRKTLAKKRGVEKKAKNPNKELQKAQKKAQKGRQKDEDDLDKLLASFKAQDLAEAAVKAERAEGGRPKGRNNFSMVAHPKKKELFLFGGESYFGGRETYHRDVHRFVINKDEWYTITSNRSPLPRASHQCVVVSVHNGHFMYMFGGEFANPGGDKFRHFGDLWRMDLQTYEWEELNSGNQKQQPGPSPRSGHRMAVWKQYIVLFGGFYDTYTTTKYYNDLWLWDLHNARWHEVKFGPRTEMPAPRSACPLSVWEDTLYVFFGYSKEVKSSSSSFLPSNTQQRKKGGKKGADEDELEDSSVGIIHSDVWSVNLVAPTTSEEEKGEESKKQTQSAPKWTKLKNKGVVPSLRVGFSMCTHKKNCVFFGGVHDDPDDGTSTFYNDLYLFNMSNQRWSPLPLLASKTQQQQSHNKSSDDEEEAQAKEEEESEEEEEAHQEDPSPSAAANADELIAPAGRFKAQTCVINNTMYLFGGVMEHNKKEYYFDDLYSLDLQKHRKFEQLAGWSQAETVGRRMKKDEEEEEDSDEDSEEESEEEESEAEEGEGEKGKEVI